MELVEAQDVEFNIPFGLGLGYVIGSNTALMADARFSLGLNSALEVFAARNNSFQFMLRLVFGV